LRTLVDNAYACDPRIQKYKDEEKRKKAEEKAAKAEAARLAHERRLAEEQEQKQREEDEKRQKEEENKQKQKNAKKEKEREKKQTKRERQKLLEYCKKQNYFTDDDSERIAMMDRVNHLCTTLQLLQLREMNSTIDNSSVEDNNKLITTQLDLLQQRVDEEKLKHLGGSNKSKKGSATTNGVNNGSSANWSYDDLQLLIKAVNLFPAGTSNRWDTVSDWFNTHGGSKPRSSKECLSKAKTLNEKDLKADANKMAYNKFQEEHLSTTAQPKGGEISVKYDGPRPWTNEEQKTLEQALRTFPNSTPERWDKIADALSGRTKKECMLRYKELVQRIKAKKAASKS
jgi:DnaJ family protein C protein 2